jgi:hypothetical protein
MQLRHRGETYYEQLHSIVYSELLCYTTHVKQSNVTLLDEDRQNAFFQTA